MAAKKLHQKILALRNSVGHLPIQTFVPSRKTSKEYTDKAVPKMEKREGGDDREIEQYFAVWGVVDDYGTMPMKGCFKKSIKERGPKSDVPGKIIVLDQHRQHMPVCVPEEIKEDDTGLYGRYTPDEIQRNNDLIVQIRSKTINNGSYGFQYVWEMMEYDDKADVIRMYECILEELSPVTFGSQRDTFVIRAKNGMYIPSDPELADDMEKLIKKLPRQHHLEVRSLINRHISLALNQPIEVEKPKITEKRERSKQRKLDLDYIMDNLNF